MDYLKGLLLGTKKMVYKDEVKLVDVPKWSEFNSLDFIQDPKL